MLNKLAFALALGTTASGAFSQTVTDIQAKQESSAYAQDVRGTILRTQYGLFWRTGYWTQGDAVIGCDGQLEPPVAKATAPAIVLMTAGAASPSSGLMPLICDFGFTLKIDLSF